MNGISMRGGDLPSSADVEAVRAWTGLGSFDPLGGGRAHRTYSDGRIVVHAPTVEAAREVEEAARAREERHGEAREGVLRAMGEALAQGYAVSPGPWAMRNCATERGRESLRRAGFEERRDGDGTVWVRPADGQTLTPGESGFVIFAEDDERGRSG